jgi:hypothetical protein
MLSTVLTLDKKVLNLKHLICWVSVVRSNACVLTRVNLF